MKPKRIAPSPKPQAKAQYRGGGGGGGENAVSFRRKMWLLYVCDEEEKELARQKAHGSCPHCGGKVEAMDVEIQRRFCFLPLCFTMKRKFFCTLCARRLELFF